MATSHTACFSTVTPHAGSVVVSIDPLRFLAVCCERRLNQALSVFVLVEFLHYVVAYQGQLLCTASFPWYVLCFVCCWLICQYLPSDWLERLLWRSLTVVRGSSPQSSGRRVFMIVFVYCIVSLFYDVCVLSPAVRDIFHTLMAQYSPFVLKLPLNTDQPTN